MTNEFDTVVEDGSLPQVSMSRTQLSSPCLQSFFSQSISFRPRLLIPTIPKSCTRILYDYLLPNGKSLIILGLSKPCLSFILLHTSFLVRSVLHPHPKGRSGHVHFHPCSGHYHSPCGDFFPFYILHLSKPVPVLSLLGGPPSKIQALT